MENRDKDKEHSNAGTMGKGAESAHNALQATQDLSHERTAAIDKLVAEAIKRESAQITVTFTAILKENSAANMPTSLKVTSRAAGIKAMPPFDWTKDKNIYQRWKLWSEKSRHTLDCMEGDSVKAKISYFHHWIDSPGMAHIESWKNNKTLISQEDYEKLDETQKEGKYSLGEIESYFTLFELLLAPKSNLSLAVKELHFLKQGSMNSGEFHSHVIKIAKRCQFPNTQAEEKSIRDAIFLGTKSQKARDKAINLMNEEGKMLTVDFLMNQLEIEDCNSHHKSLSQLDSTSSVNFAAYDHRQNKGRKSRKNRGNGKDQAQNKSGVQGSS